MLEHYCDILVIGTELPGLITAAFLARRGLSVQVLDTDRYAEHVRAPDPTCLTNVHSKLLRSILGRLNVPEMTIQHFLALESTLQVIFAKNRIDVLSSPLAYFEELEREFPDLHNELKLFYENQARDRHQTDINELFQRLLPTGWSERRSLKRFIRDNKLDLRSPEYQHLGDADPRLAAFFKAQFLLSTQAFVHDPFGYQVAELFNPGDGEIFSVHAGSKHLKKILVDRLIQHDGNIRRKIQVTGLPFQNGALEGVELADGGGTVLSKYTIWNGDLAKLAEILPRKWRFRGLRRQCTAYESNFHWFSVRFEVDRHCVPDPMKTCVIDIAQPDKELTGGNLIYLQVGHQDKASTTAKIDVSLMLSKSALGEPEEFFEPYFEAIRNRLTRLMPFSGDSLRCIFPQKQARENTDTLFPLSDNDYEIFRERAHEHGIADTRARCFQDLFGLHYQTPAPNFFITHPNIFAAFGLESKLILGLKITDLIWQEVDKAKKRAMKAERRIA